ncbi:MAG: FHA domain-containing protein [Bdellovibrionales bacterium]|nr:FHA domain-containing protein [Bdellovibrionales bacterium]
MSNSAVAISPAAATKWTVISGTMKGSVRLMNAPSFDVGRSPDCGFVIVNDPKCSRKHAQVESDGFSCEVISLNDKNLVQVNGKGVERAILQDGDVVTFGDTEVQFNQTAVSGSPLSVVHQDYGGSPAMYGGASAPSRPRSSKSGRPKTSKKAGTNRLIIYGVLGLLGFWLFSGSPAKKKEQQIRSEKQIQADIETANKLREAAEAVSLKKMNNSVTARQAQENYVRGFRDFKKGQFERSLTSFQACLALNPEHVLCNRYQRLSQRKFDELIQYQVVLGRKYREQNQYKACRAAFRNVIVMVKDASSPIYQEAKANYEACDRLTEGRF